MTIRRNGRGEGPRTNDHQRSTKLDVPESLLGTMGELQLESYSSFQPLFALVIGGSRCSLKGCVAWNFRQFVSKFCCWGVFRGLSGISLFGIEGWQWE